MSTCHKCGSTVGNFGSEFSSIELTFQSTSSREVYTFDTKACLVTWVRETYGTESS